MYRMHVGLFFGTVGIGAWVAFDQGAALEKLAILAVGIAVLFLIDLAGRIDAKRTLVLGGIGCAAVAAILGTLVLGASLRLYYMRVDAIAAALIILLPVGGGSALWLWRRGFGAAAEMTGLATLWALMMLLLTGERSAWLALAVGILCGWAIWQRFVLARSGRRVWPLDLAGIGVTVMVLVIYSLAITMPELPRWLPVGESRTASSHLQLWRNALVLIQDYPFTGSGLNVTGMTYSSYVLLLPVPLHAHVHNLYLQITIEQGWVGLVAFLGMVLTVSSSLAATWHDGSSHDDGLRTMTVVALAALFAHGFLDSELYASGLAALLFLPIGFVHVAARLDQYVIDDVRFGSVKGTQYPAGGMILLAGGAAVLALAFLPAARAALQANLGAIVQTHRELSVYTWQEWADQDAVRRAATVSLGPAIARYEAALTIYPENVTALRRLGQIALSRGDYDDARRYLEQAHTQAPQQLTIHLLLGEALAVTGDVEQAAALFRSASVRPSWLDQRQWWYTHIGATQEAAWLADAITLVNHQHVANQ